MAKFTLTNTPLNLNSGNVKVPEWMTFPGGLYAAGIAIDQFKQHRPVGQFHALDPEGARAKLMQEKGISGTPTLTNVAAVNPISIIDIDMPTSVLKSNKLHGGWEKIVLPTVPLELEYDPNPNWAVIASIGRNAPFYHYVGSEDSLSFKIDWYSKEDHRQDVIFYCRWLEARSKANSYYEDPHRIILVWGNDDLLFKDSVWIVAKATYKLSQFVKNRGMLPQQAYQEVTFKRVLKHNSDYPQIIGDLNPAGTTLSGANPYPSNLDRSTLPKGI